MRKIEFRRIQSADFADRFAPRFDVEFGWNKGRGWRATPKTNSGNIAPQNGIVPVIDVVMARVTGRGDRADLEWSYPSNFIIFQDSNASSVDREKFPPEPFHVVAVKARR